MSIRSAAYDLCKGLWDAPCRKQINELILGLKDGLLHYYGHHEYAQLLGYLMVDQERARFETGPHPTKIFPLRDDQRQLLAAAHNQIVELNRQCAAPLIESLPKCAKAINPYNKYNYNTPTAFIECDFLSPESVNKMANAFQGHPQITIARESSAAIPDEVTEEIYTEDVWKMREEFVSAGPLKYPDWLKKVLNTQSETSRYRTYLRHLAALTSIRESLATLNQLIYQKIFYERLLVLDEEYIIKGGPYVLGTGGISLVFQFAGIFYLMEPHDIILAKLVALPSEPLESCRVETFHMPFPPGEPAYVELRVIDENLNPFGALVKGF
jgi:hypothetical protein